MPKPTPKPSEHWLSKLGDNERKYVEKNRSFVFEKGVSMYHFLLNSFRYDQRLNDKFVNDLLKRALHKNF